MEKQTEKPTQDSSKVLNLFAPRNKATDDGAAEKAKVEATKSSESSFLEEMRKNAENADRLKKERLKANQGVLKSYRIKN